MVAAIKRRQAQKPACWKQLWFLR